MTEARRQEIYEDMRQRAIAEEDNATHPGHPTLVGWVNVIISDIVDLKMRAEVEPTRRADD